MRIIDIATSVRREALVPLSELQRLYRWSDRNQRIFERFFGFRSVCLHRGTEIAALLRGCLRDLVMRNAELRGCVDYLIYGHSLHSTTCVDRRFLEEMGLDLLHCRPESFSVTQGSCASGMLAVRLLQSLLAQPKPIRAVLLTGEKCFHPTVQYADQNGIFGEGATAVYFSNHSADIGVAVAAVATHTMHGLSTRPVAASLELCNQYDREFISMMVATIQSALQAARISAGQIAAILPYHVSPPTFDRLAREIGLSPEIVVRTNLFEIGHCFCGDAFMNLRSWLRREAQPFSSGYLLALASGVAGTFAAMILKVEDSDELRVD